MSKQVFIDFFDFVESRGLTSPTFFKILRALLEKDGRTIEDLTKEAGVSKVQVRAVLRQMIANEVVERKVRRSKYILTKEEQKRFIRKPDTITTYHLNKTFKSVLEGDA